jgi:hypothetical protein
VLFIMISRNRARNVIFIPFSLMMIFISPNRVSVILFVGVFPWEGLSHIVLGRIIIINSILIQLSCIWRMEDVGSKIENRLVIIFSSFYWSL